MVISLIVFITIIIVIIMASIFRCCWSKKDARDLKQSKSIAIKEESIKDKSSSKMEKPENGVVAEIPSASKCESKLPLLSPAAMEDSNEDEDFSAVKRETEILRTYRKPQPPKRARQTRAPRVAKSGTTDLFTGLIDEGVINSSDKENDDDDSTVLRQDKDKSKRDTRSSMLTEIEQTLAALHMEEHTTTPPSVDLLHEHKFTTSGLIHEDIAKIKSENSWMNLTGSADKCSSSQNPLSSDIKPEPAVTTGKDSPKVSPKVKPRTGPNVSPKPSPKPRSKLGDNTTTASTSTDMKKDPSDNLANVSFISSLEFKLNGTRGSVTIPEVNTPPQSVHLEKQAPTDVELLDTTLRVTTALSRNEATTNIDSNLGLPRAELQPDSGYEDLELTEEQKQEAKIKSSSSSSSYNITAKSEATTHSEDVAVGRIIDENTVKEFRKSVSIEKKGDESNLSNHNLNKSISVEKEEDTNLDNQKLNKSTSVEKEETTNLDNQKLNKSTSVEKEETTNLDNQKLNESTSVEKEETTNLDNQNLNKSTSVEKEETTNLDNQKLNKSTSVEKEEDTNLDNQKLNKSISMEKDEKIRYQNQTSISNDKETAQQNGNETLQQNGKKTVQQNGKETDQAKQNGTDKLTTKDMKYKTPEGTAQQSSPERETPSNQNEDMNRGRSQESGKHRRESSEDQTGKGKTSKIPVRAGSKPRTSPPKMMSGEKASSPTK